MASHSFMKVVIGRADKVYFVGLLNKGVPAKVDTGAYRCAVHAENIREEKGVLYFDLLEGHPTQSKGKSLKRKSFNKVRIENSFGDEEERYEVKLRVKLGHKIFTAPFTLANRSKKTFPILLGRNILNRRFLVDTSYTAVNRKKLIESFGDRELDEEEAEG